MSNARRTRLRRAQASPGDPRRNPWPGRRSIAGLATAMVVVGLGVVGTGTAAALASPTLAQQASASGFPVGIQIYDSANLGGGVVPTGSLTFTLFGPTDPTCAGPPLFTTHKTVNGNGYYESARYTTTVAGTYRFRVRYNGDALNNPTPLTPCADPPGQVEVAKRIPNLSASARWAPPSADDTASLSMGAGPSGPTGTMTFRLYGPDDPTCARPPVTTNNRSVAGNGSYTSPSFAPTLLGTYQYVVSYSGDANNLARGTICTDPANRFVVSTSPPAGATVSASPATVPRGGTITVTWAAIATPTAKDWIGLYRTGTPDGGTVTAWRFTTGAAGGSLPLTFPWGATAGTYEVRLMANNTTERLATSGPITLVW